MEYYERYYYMYASCTEEERQLSKDHWTKCHRENLKEGRKDLIMFSASILASIALADAELKSGKLSALTIERSI